MYVFDETGQLVLAGGYEEQYETAGGAEVGFAPALANRGRAPVRQGAAQQLSRQQNLRAIPQASQFFVPPGAAANNWLAPGALAPQSPPQQGVPEARARQIAQEEIARVGEQRGRQIAQEEIARALNAAGVMSAPPRPVDGELMAPLGLGVLTFTGTSGTSLTLSAKPQRGFRGERLVLDIRRIGASALATPVILSRMAIGDRNQLIGGGALPADVFAADAFGVRLMMDGAVPGINVDLTFTIAAALTPGDVIFVSGAIIGRASEAQGG